MRGNVDSLARILAPFMAGPIAALGAAHWAVASAGIVAVAGGALSWLLLPSGGLAPRADDIPEGSEDHDRRGAASDPARRSTLPIGAPTELQKLVTNPPNVPP